RTRKMTTKREKLLHAELALDPRRRGHPSAADLETTGFPSAPIPDRVRRPAELLDRRAIDQILGREVVDTLGTGTVGRGRRHRHNQGPKPHHLGRELVKLAKMISPVARSSTADHSSSASGSSRSTPPTSKSVPYTTGLRHSRLSRPATVARTRSKSIMGRFRR